MEERDAPLAEEVVEPPFSELMRRWLDEGDQLSERGVTSPTAAAARSATPLGQALSRLRAGVERYRVFVLAGVGLLPLALFTATHQRAAGAIVAAATVSSAPPATGPTPTPPPVVHETAASASKIPVAAHESGVVAPKPRPAARTTAVIAAKPQPHRPHRQRHRHPSGARRAR
jgi:hypothetical protein